MEELIIGLQSQVRFAGQGSEILTVPWEELIGDLEANHSQSLDKIHWTDMPHYVSGDNTS
jgi:hypothetical protein